ncbi:MAG: SdrD B-like domain-containing protein, partial [Acidobacteriota bacterium]
MSSKVLLQLGFALTLATAPALAQTPTLPIGDEIQVNSYTTGNQRQPVTAALADGTFLVVWQSAGSDHGDTSGSSLQARRYDSSGVPVGDAFLVNSYTSGSQSNPAVAPAADGSFIVAWSSDGSDGDDTSGTSIQGQRFGADGAALGAPFQVNTYTTDDQTSPDIAVDGDGRFTVVWASDGSDNGDSSDESVQGQRFASDGAPLGAQFLVNTYTSSDQTQAKVAATESGDFTVVWRSQGSDNGDGTDASIQAQRFASDGATLGAQFLVNSYTSSNQEFPDVAMTPDGGLIVAWESFGSDNGDTANQSIQLQRFASDGTATGGETLVNTFTTGSQRGPTVSADAAGDFVVTWRSYGSDNGDNSLNSVQAQRFASDGAPVAGQFRVNTVTLNSQTDPAVAVATAGDFFIAWESLFSPDDADGSSVKAQAFAVSAAIGDRVFLDVDADGRQSISDLGAAGVTVHLRDGLGDLVSTTATDADGAFLFQPKIGLGGAADEFFLDVEPGPGQTFTIPGVGDDDTIDSDVDSLGLSPSLTIVAPGGSFLDLDAGLISDGAIVGDRVWSDANFDGVQQIDEVSLAGVTVRLLDQNGTTVDTAVTDADGLYGFSGLVDGTYRLQIDPPQGGVLSDSGIGDEPLLDSDFDPVSLQTALFAYTANTDRRDFDAGVLLPGSAGQVPTVADGDVFRVNSYTEEDQKEPEVASAPDGGFVVVWESRDATLDSSGLSVQGQVFDAGGSSLGVQFQSN